MSTDMNYEGHTDCCISILLNLELYLNLSGRDSKTALMNAGKLAHLIRADDDTKESLLQILDGLGAIIRVLNCSESEFEE